MPVSSTKMVFLAYFGGNILNGVKWVVEKKKNN
jgi:hypothetical protein